MKMVPFIGQAYQHRSNDVSSQRSVNLYPEIVDDTEAKSKYILIGTPGSRLYKDLSDITTGNCRGLYSVSAKKNVTSAITARTFGVYGNKLIEIVSETLAIEHATISDLSSRISFCDTGEFLVFVDGSNMYSFNLDTSITSETTLPFKSPIKVLFINNRVIAINTDETIDIIRNYNKFYWSDLNKPNDWNAIDWASAEGSGDPITSISKKQGEVWLFGPQSFEVWRGTVNPNKPYSRVGGSFGEIGIGSIDSSSEIVENIFWLGSSRAGKNQVYKSNGYNADRISTHAIEKALDDAGVTTTDAVGFTYQQEGHIFYILTLVQADQTWVYDLTTGQWHERATRDPRLNELHKWAPLFSTFGNETVLVGNSNGPQILELDLNQYIDYNFNAPNNQIPIVRIRQSPTYWEALKQVFHREFQLDVESGVGIQELLQGNDPQIMLQYSDDGGHSFSSENWTSLGKIGEYSKRVKWRRLGRSRERVYRVTVSDPVKVIMLGARLVTDVGVNR